MTKKAVKVLLLYDGICGLCNRTVNWLLRHDTHGRIQFAPNSHPRVQEILERYGRLDKPQTIILVLSPFTHSERILTHSEAVLFALRLLPSPWPSLARLAASIPSRFRDDIYEAIARNRYKLFGKLESCPVPSEKDREHFLP